VLAAALAATLGAALPARAQLEEDFQTWNRLTLRGSFAGGPRWGIEIEGRLRQGSRELGQFLIRPYVTLRSSPQFAVNLGFANFLNWPSGAGDVTVETRLFQDFTYAFDVERLTINQRIRLEERWIPNADAVSLRARYRLQLQHPLDGERRWLINLSDELIYNLNTPGGAGPPGGFEQNRVILSFIHRFTPQLSFELGYQGNYFERPAPRADQFNHNLLIYFTYDFDGR